MSKKKRRPTRPSRPSSPSLPKQLVADLFKAEWLMSRGRSDEALELLRSLDQVSPNRAEVLIELASACYEQRDFAHHLAVFERLNRLRPNDPEITLGLAGSRMLNLRPALALTTFRRFLERWPEHEQADEVRKTVAEMEPVTRQMLADTGLTGPDALELAILHEEAQSLLQQGRYPQARQTAEELLRRRPEFAPALNNISLTYRIGGDLDSAIRTARHVLSFDPHNFHALANLTQYLIVAGRREEATVMAERLKAVQSDAADFWTKQAEAFTYLGDDQAVMEAIRRAELSEQGRPPPEEALLFHLAAVASMRLGDEQKARRHWQQALKADPGMDVARANLDDLAQPAGSHHAPWPFAFPQWVPHRAIKDLAKQVESVSAKQSEEALRDAVRRYLDEYPQMAALVPLLLDRGDPATREFGLRVAMMSQTPEMLEALRDFALGQRGPDSMRHEAARAAAKAELLPSGPVRLWLGGEWRETLLIGWELHNEPISHHPRRVEVSLNEAAEALDAGDNEAAGQLFEQALAVEPDAPDLLYNCAIAYGREGRSEEAGAIARQLFARHPDYPFARTSMAQILVRRGEISEAKALLEPLLSRERLHFSEFAALCTAQIDLYLAEGNREAARSWLEMWAAADPDNPAIAHWRRRLGSRT